MKVASLFSSLTVFCLAAPWMLGCSDDAVDLEDPSVGGNPAGGRGSQMEGGAGAGGQGPQLGECNDYMPSEAGDSMNGSWPEQGAEVDYSLTVPSDPGGGYVKVEVTTDATDTSPSVRVVVPGDEAGAVVSGSSAGLADEQTTTHYFEAAPGQSYRVYVDQFGNSPDDAYPVAHSFSWSYRSVVDCYEPNDEPSQAKMIPLNTEVEAYSLDGHISNTIGNPQFVDWYEVELAEAGVLEVELVQAPGDDDRMSIGIYDASGEDRVGGGNALAGELFTATTDDPVEPGTYLIAVNTVDAAPRTAVKGAPLPKAWTTPYRIEVTVE